MLDQPVDFKDQMIEARRTQILLGAAQVFAEKGFHRATTKEIARAAGVSEGTIYNYFDNKRDLLVAMVDLIGMQSLKTIMTDQPPEDLQELLTAILRDRFDLVNDFGYIMAPLFAELFNDEEIRNALYQQVIIPTSKRMEDYIQSNIELGRLRRVNPVVATRAIIGAAVFNFALKITELDPRYQNVSSDALIDELTSIFVHGLASHGDAEK